MLTEVDLLRTYLLTLQSDIAYEQNRLKRLRELAGHLSSHDETERDAFGLLRRLVDQSVASIGHAPEDVEQAMEVLARLRRKLEDRGSVSHSEIAAPKSE